MTISVGCCGSRPSAAGRPLWRPPDPGRRRPGASACRRGGPGEPGTGEGDGHFCAQPRPHTVRQSRPGIGFMEHDRDVPPPGGKIHGRADIPADADENVGTGLVQDHAGLLDGAGEAGREAGAGPATVCAESGTRLMVASSTPAAGTSRASIPSGVPTARSRARGGFPDRMRDGEQRADVPGCSAAGEDDGQGRLGTHEGLLPLSCWVLGCWVPGRILGAGLAGAGLARAGLDGAVSAFRADRAAALFCSDLARPAGPNRNIPLGCMPGAICARARDKTTPMAHRDISRAEPP